MVMIIKRSLVYFLSSSISVRGRRCKMGKDEMVEDENFPCMEVLRRLE